MHRSTLVDVRLEFRPEVHLINSTRDYLSTLCNYALGDAEAASRLGLTAHELLENVLKYSTDGIATVDVGLAERSDGSVVRIRTQNRARPPEMAEVARLVGALSRAADPAALYYEMLENTSDSDEMSGLGLARIRVEGRMSLTYETAGDRVTITAETRVGPGAD